MALIRRAAFASPRQWHPAQVPTGAVEIDKSQELASGLVGCYLPGGLSGLTDLCGIGPTLAPYAAPAIVANPFGPGLASAAVAQGAYAPAYAAYGSLLTAATSLFWKGSFPTAYSGNYGAVLWGFSAHSTDSSPYYANAIERQSGGDVGDAFSFGNGVAAAIASDAGVTSVASTFDGANSELFTNGTGQGLVSANGNTPTLYSGATGSQLSFGWYDPAQGRTVNAISNLGLIYNRALSPAEVAQLHAAPFALLRPVVRRQYYVGVGGGTAFTATPGAGVVALTGLSPSPSAGAVAAAGAGRLAVTGNAPIPAADATAASGAGLIALTGIGPAASAAVRAAPGVGSLSVAGNAAALAASAAAIPGAGLIAQAGAAPALSAGAAATPGAGAIGLTGAGPTPAANVTALPGSGLLALAGFAASFASGASVTAQPGAGAVILTGLAPTPAANATALPGSGQTALTGLPAIFSSGSAIIVQPGAGAVTLTGLAPTPVANATALPGSGQMALTGLPAIFSSGSAIIVQPGAGAISLTGSLPTLSAAATSAAGATTVALAGLAPTPAASASLPAGAGGIALSGPSAAFSASASAVPGAGLISFAGYAPSFGTGVDVRGLPGAGSVVATGLAVTLSADVSVDPGSGLISFTGYPPAGTPAPFAPSGLRAIPLFDQAIAAPRGAIATILPLRWPAKLAAATLDFALDASALQATPTDILAATLNASTNVQAVMPPVVIGGLVTLFLSGGIAGADGLLDLTLTTAAGRQVRRIVRLGIL
ncbi:hypothetical protein [Rhodopila sp.]|uniref:phage fiber-tail adaptor protein n=1 Tax=Rhodopila sp. TaxID=2480087 RepID=UPI003D13223F